MIVVWLTIAALFGFAVGNILTKHFIEKSDREAIQDGIIELDGKLYLIKEFDYRP